MRLLRIAVAEILFTLLVTIIIVACALLLWPATVLNPNLMKKESCYERH